MLEFTVTPTYDDYYAANRLVRTKAWSPAKIAKPALIMFLVCVVFAQIGATSDGVAWREQLPYSLGIGIVAAAVWLLVCFGLGELRLGAQARKMLISLELSACQHLIGSILKACRSRMKKATQNMHGYEFRTTCSMAMCSSCGEQTACFS
jgi:hypothetical protein